MMDYLRIIEGCSRSAGFQKSALAYLFSFWAQGSRTRLVGRDGARQRVQPSGFSPLGTGDE